jgi:cytochrome c553
MPWPVMAKMSNRDLRAIYEYLRAIPPRADNPAPGPAEAFGARLLASGRD